MVAAVGAAAVACAGGGGSSGSAGSGSNSGHLQVQVKALPVGVAADVTLTGPHNYRRHLTGATTLSQLRPGQYHVVANPVSDPRDRFYATPDQLDVDVASGRVGIASVDYADLIPSTTKVIDPRDLRSPVGDPSAAGLVQFASTASNVKGLHPGDILVAASGPAAPQGLLRRVIAVRSTPDGVDVDTSPATLHDAVPRGRLEFHRDLTTQSVTGSGPGGGVRRFSLRDGIQWNLTFGYGACGVGPTGDLQPPEVDFSVNPTVDFEVDWGVFSPNRVRFVAGLDEHADATFKSGDRYTCKADKKTPDPPEKLDSFEVQVGPIPVVVTPQFQLNGTLRGSLTKDSGVTVHQALQAHAGVQWENGNLSGIHDFSKSLSGQPLASSSFDISLKAGPELTFSVYGLGGPYANEQFGVRTTTSAGQTTGYGGLYFSAGVKLDFLNFKLEYQLPNLINFEDQLFQFNEPTTSTTSTTTAPATTAPATTASSTTTPATSATTTTTTTTTTSPSQPPVGAACANPMSPQDARSFVATQVGPYGPWVPEASTYDPSLDLSAIEGDTPGATASSPVQVFLFHKGCFLGTTTSNGNYFNSTFAQTGSDTVSVHYAHYQPTDGNCCPSLPEYVVRYHWDGDHVVPLDPLPPLGQGLPY